MISIPNCKKINNQGGTKSTERCQVSVSAEKQLPRCAGEEKRGWGGGAWKRSVPGGPARHLFLYAAGLVDLRHPFSSQFTFRVAPWPLLWGRGVGRRRHLLSSGPEELSACTVLSRRRGASWRHLYPALHRRLARSWRGAPLPRPPYFLVSLCFIGALSPSHKGNIKMLWIAI